MVDAVEAPVAEVVAVVVVPCYPRVAGAVVLEDSLPVECLS